MKKDFQNTLRVAVMSPLDAKNQVSKLSELKDLGENDNKAFTYYRGMIIYCHEDGNRYEWTDQLSNKEVLLDKNFKYPRGSVFEETDYSNKVFNFVIYQVSDNTGFNFLDKPVQKEVLVTNKTLLDSTDGVIQHNLGAVLIVDIKVIFPEKIYNQNCPHTFSLIELMMFKIIESYSIIDSNSFKINKWTNYQNMEDVDDFYLLIDYLKEDG